MLPILAAGPCGSATDFLSARALSARGASVPSGIPHHDSGAVPQTTAVSTDQGITRDGSMRLDGRRRLGWH